MPGTCYLHTHTPVLPAAIIEHLLVAVPPARKDMAGRETKPVSSCGIDCDTGERHAQITQVCDTRAWMECELGERVGGEERAVYWAGEG